MSTLLHPRSTPPNSAITPPKGQIPVEDDTRRDALFKLGVAALVALAGGAEYFRNSGPHTYMTEPQRAKLLEWLTAIDNWKAVPITNGQKLVGTFDDGRVLTIIKYSPTKDLTTYTIVVPSNPAFVYEASTKGPKKELDFSKKIFDSVAEKIQ